MLKESHHATVHGERIHYLVGGQGPPLILVHGLASSGTLWRYAFDGLAAHHRVYAIDLPGCGLSSSSRLIRLNQSVEFLRSWLDAIAVPRAHVLGHSWGGAVAIRLAATSPDRVSRLILVNSAGLPLGGPVPLLIPRLFRSGSPIRRDALGVIARDLFQTGPRNIVAMALDITRDDVSALLPTITVPTLVIWGSNDHLVPVRLGEKLVELIPGAHLIVLPGAGHNVMIDAPDAFNRAVLSFLAEDRTRPDSRGAYDVVRSAWQAARSRLRRAPEPDQT
jgi:pimeloyl-ACP methyl ester carboxylesterase